MNLCYLKLENLTYDFDSRVRDTKNTNYDYFYRNLTMLETCLPVIPKEIDNWVINYFPRIIAVYESIVEKGIINPLIVVKKANLYQVRVGNQRLCGIRAKNNNFKDKVDRIPCIISTNVKQTSLTTKFIYVEGCEGK